MQFTRRLNVAFDILFVLILALIPLLWFTDGHLITGADIDYPLDPVLRLTQRAFVWDPIILGRNQALDTSTIFITATEAFFYSLSGSVIASEKLTFVFWYSLSGFGMLFLMQYFAPGSDATSRVKRLGAVLFYMMNFYQIHAWEMVRLGEIPALASLPILLRLLINGLQTSSPAKAWNQLPQIALASLLAASVGLNVAVLSVFLFVLFAYFMFDIVSATRSIALSKTAYFVIFVAIFVAVNAYWVFPLVVFVASLGISTGQAISIFDTFDLLRWTSANNGLLNVIRQYGDIFWFDGYGGEQYYPFFLRYQSNAFLISISLLLPLLAYGALLLKDRKIPFFAILAVIGTVLSQGIHLPFGVVFAWMIENVPNFWIFRAPWQRWAIPTTLGYAVLAGLSLGQIFRTLARGSTLPHLGFHFRSNRYLNRRTLAVLVVVGLTSLQGLYMQPLILGQMFPDVSQRHVLPYFYYHLSIPGYVYQTSEWLNSQPDVFRIGLFPPKRALSYTWGYGGSKDIILNLVEKPVVFVQYGEGFSFPHPRDELFAVFSSLVYSNYTSASSILDIMSVRYLVQRNDIWYNFFPDIDSPDFVRQKLGSQPGLEYESSFGLWDVYLNPHSRPYIYGTVSPSIILGEPVSAAHLGNRISDNPSSAFFFSSQTRDSDLRTLVGDSTLPLSVVSFGESPESQGFNANGNLTYILSSSDISARYYSGWKQLVSTDGSGSSDMIVFPSPGDSPYVFPSWSSPSWSALNSTILYVRTGSTALAINGIFNSTESVQDIIGVWWRSGWVGMSTREVRFPIVIPPGEFAIVQIGHILSDTLTVSTSAGTQVVPVSDGWRVPVPSEVLHGFHADSSPTIFLDDDQSASWSGIGEILLADDPLDKVSGANSLMLKLNQTSTAEIGHSFETPASFPESHFLSFYWKGNGNGQRIRVVAQTNGWNDYFYYDLVDSDSGWRKIEPNLGDFVQVGSGNWSSISELKIAFPEDSSPWTGTYHLDRVGHTPPAVTFVFATAGQNTYTLRFPSVKITPSNAFITIDAQDPIHITQDESGGVYVDQVPLASGIHNITLTGFLAGDPWLMVNKVADSSHIIPQPVVSFQKIDPTRFRVRVNSSGPFLLIMSEPFDKGWKAYYGDVAWTRTLSSAPIDEQKHFVANGFGNAWYIEKTGDLILTLFYEPQTSFNLGLMISLGVTVPVLVAIIRPIRAGTLDKVQIWKLQRPASRPPGKRFRGRYVSRWRKTSRKGGASNSESGA